MYPLVSSPKKSDGTVLGRGGGEAGEGLGGERERKRKNKRSFMQY